MIPSLMPKLDRWKRNKEAPPNEAAAAFAGLLAAIEEVSIDYDLLHTKLDRVERWLQDSASSIPKSDFGGLENRFLDLSMRTSHGLSSGAYRALAVEVGDLERDVRAATKR